MKKHFILAEQRAEREGTRQIGVKSFDLLPIVPSMSGIRAEPRTALIAQAEVSWEEQSGVSHNVPARMEDRSPSGVCLRVRVSIEVGSKVKIKWRWEEFWGIAKYCRSVDGEYLLGVQRTSKEQDRSSPFRTDPIRERIPGQVPPPSKDSVKNIPESQGRNLHELPGTTLKSRPESIAPSASITPVISEKTVSPAKNRESQPLISQSEELNSPGIAEGQTERPSQDIERTNMSTKWLDVAFGRQKQNGPNGKTNTAPLPMAPAPAQSAPADKVPSNPTGIILAKPEGDLQSMEDIYHAAGIMNPRMGYSISKVVEMLNNDHIRGLSNDAKRAAVLMALEAAGISIDQVLRDAKIRQQALDEYETDQRKLFEEYWTRKAEANAQTQTEMERITAQCLDRMKRNLDEVALEKAAFARWQTMKQQEADRITEAAGLCSKPSPAEAPVASLPALGGMGNSVKPS
jgi:hypothetical protein